MTDTKHTSKIVGYNWNKVNELAVKQVGKPAVYVSFGLDFGKPEDEAIWAFVTATLSEMYDKQTYLDLTGSIINSELIFFDTKEEQYRFYKIFEQPLTDSSPLYAVTYSRDGKTETENT